MVGFSIVTLVLSGVPSQVSHLVIIATSHDEKSGKDPKGSKLEGKWDPLFQGNLGR